MCTMKFFQLCCMLELFCNVEQTFSKAQNLKLGFAAPVPKERKLPSFAINICILRTASLRDEKHI